MRFFKSLKKLLVYFFCVLSVASAAQARKRDYVQQQMGLFLGGSYYIGDLNPRKHFSMSRPALGVFYRYAPNYRAAFRVALTYGEIRGNDAKSKEPDQIERNLNFKSRIYELNVTSEFNFVEYRIGLNKYRFTMYVFAGLGVFYFNPQANIGNGYEALKPIQTEGKKYPLVQPNIPFGLGLKWAVGKKMGLGLEWGPRRTFTDYLDDVSGTYPASTNPDTKNYTNQSLNGGGVAGNMRGNPSTRDWYFYYGLSFNFALPDPYNTCYGKGRKAHTRRRLPKMNDGRKTVR